MHRFESQRKFSHAQEPMYIILNTAISHRWGMPEPCDHEHCSACWICYDCMNPGTVLYFLWTAILVHSFKVNDPYLYEDTSFGSLNAYMLVLRALECQCTLPDTLKNCASLPATMKIDYIRLYQDKSDPQHSLGCDTEQFPTATFIREHAGISTLQSDIRPDTWWWCTLSNRWICFFAAVDVIRSICWLGTRTYTWAYVHLAMDTKYYNSTYCSYIDCTYVDGTFSMILIDAMMLGVHCDFFIYTVIMQSLWHILFYVAP